MNEVISANIKKETAINGGLNAVLNGLIIWFMKKDGGTVSLVGEDGFGMDITITAVALMFLITMIVMAIQRRKVRKGNMVTFNWDLSNRMHRVLAAFPRSVWLSGLIFGVVGLIVVAPVTLGPMALLGFTEMTPMAYAIFKGVWAGILAALIIPPIIMLALAEPKAESQGEPAADQP